MHVTGVQIAIYGFKYGLRTTSVGIGKRTAPDFERYPYMRQLMVVANRDIVISHRESNRLMKVISTYGMRKDPLTGIYKKHNGVDLTQIGHQTVIR